MRGAAIWIGLAVLPSLAAAQEPDAPARLLKEFAFGCAHVFADPRAAINEIANHKGAVIQASITSDGAMATIYEPIDLEDGVKGSTTFNQVVAGGKARQICSLFVYMSSDVAPMYDDMVEVIDAQAAAILAGPAVRAGDPIANRPSRTPSLALFVWSRDDGAPIVLTLNQGNHSFTVSIDRIVPAP